MIVVVPVVVMSIRIVCRHKLYIQSHMLHTQFRWSNIFECFLFFYLIYSCCGCLKWISIARTGTVINKMTLWRRCLSPSIRSVVCDIFSIIFYVILLFASWYGWVDEWRDCSMQFRTIQSMSIHRSTTRRLLLLVAGHHYGRGDTARSIVPLQLLTQWLKCDCNEVKLKNMTFIFNMTNRQLAHKDHPECWENFISDS